MSRIEEREGEGDGDGGDLLNEGKEGIVTVPIRVGFPSKGVVESSLVLWCGASWGSRSSKGKGFTLSPRQSWVMTLSPTSSKREEKLQSYEVNKNKNRSSSRSSTQKRDFPLEP